jgi:hypothetical protein
MPLDIALMRKWRGDGPEAAVMGAFGVVEAKFIGLAKLEAPDIKLVE